jgi:hypothetical protein
MCKPVNEAGKKEDRPINGYPIPVTGFMRNIGEDQDREEKAIVKWSSAKLVEGRSKWRPSAKRAIETDSGPG